MKKFIKNESKRQYVAPSLVRLGDIGIKTLGAHDYRFDKHTSGCMDQSGKDTDPCYVAHHS